MAVRPQVVVLPPSSWVRQMSGKSLRFTSRTHYIEVKLPPALFALGLDSGNAVSLLTKPKKKRIHPRHPFLHPLPLVENMASRGRNISGPQDFLSRLWQQSLISFLSLPNPCQPPTGSAFTGKVSERKELLRSGDCVTQIF